MKRPIIILCALLIACGSFAASNGLRVYPSKVLVVLAEYDDVAFNAANDAAAYTNFFNGANYTDGGATGSVQQYFRDQSYGKFVPEFDVVGPVKLPQKRAYYGANDYDDEDSAAEEMVAEACELADAQGVDFTKYDVNGDGYVDAVIVVYAGQGETDKQPDYVYPQTSMLYDDLIVDNKVVSLYSCVPELNEKQKRAGMGELVYQFSHILGLPMLSDTEGGDEKTLGDWDVMDHGCYNNGGNTPAAYSAYERFYLGWVEPILLNEPMNVRLRDLNESGDCAIITRSGQTNLLGDNPDPREFFILENRQQAGWDKHLPGHGMLITKIDYVRSRWEGDEVNVLIKGKPSLLVDIIEADGKEPKYKADNLTNGYFGKQGDTYPSGATSKKFFSDKWYIDNISEAGKVVKFLFQGGVESGCKVNFSAGSNGTAAKTSETESAPFAGVTLPNVTPKTGYTFLGWASRTNSTVADAGKAGDKFYPMTDCSVFALYRNEKLIDIKYENYKGVEWISGAMEHADRGKAFEITYKEAEGYQVPAAGTCQVKVTCGGKEMPNYFFEDGLLVIRFTAAEATDNITISIINSRFQDENGCATYEHTFSQACLAGTQDLSNYEWQVRFGNSEGYTGFSKTKGAQFGSGTKPANGVSLYTTETSGCGVKRVEVECSMASGGDAMLDVYIAGNFMGNSEELTESTETYVYELDEPQSGSVEIAFTNSMKAIYVKRIAIFYEYIDPMPTDVIESETNTNKAGNWQKVLIDGHLYIVNDGVIYTIQGTRIQ